MSLMDRIIGAFTFKREVYADVKKDTSFTPTAWGIVVVVNLLNQFAGYLAAGAIATATIGALGGLGDLGQIGAVASGSLVGSLVSAVVGVLAFAIGAWVIMFVANSVFKANAKFDEVVRTVGLANVWGLVGVLVILAVISPIFLCLTGIVGLAAAILSAVASAIAVKEAIGLDWTQTIVTIVIAWVVMLIITSVVGGAIAAATFAASF
jgi:hypothetical protein